MESCDNPPNYDVQPIKLSLSLVAKETLSASHYLATIPHIM
jgi:hypothetical protein